MIGGEINKVVSCLSQMPPIPSIPPMLSLPADAADSAGSHSEPDFSQSRQRDSQSDATHAGSELTTLYDIMHAAGESEEYGPTAEEYANGTAKPYRNRWDRFRNFDINPTVGGDIVADIYGEEADIYGEDSERATQMCPQCHGTYSPWVARCPMCLAPTPGGPLDPHALWTWRMTLGGLQRNQDWRGSGRLTN
ncbi:MAG: hypothetical protein PUF97_03480 [Bifidobacteriaceae bacterium]|nr:hypothetical protein [Bifidobacteriaceae bacterium]